MKNVQAWQKKKCIFVLYDEYEELVQNLLKEATGLDCSVSLEWGELGYESEGGEQLPDINEILSAYFGVTVTSVHTDSADLVGVWIAYTK